MTLLLPPPGAVEPPPRPDAPERPALQPTTPLATQVRHPRRRAGIGAAMILVLVASWMISGFWISVQTRSPREPYPAPTAHQAWVRSPEGGSRAYFRLRLPIASSTPQTATLWVEGVQEVTTYVNGFQVAPVLAATNKLIDTAPDLPKVVQTIDIRPFVRPGINIVGLEVVSLNGQAPAFRARIEVRTGGLVQDFGMVPATWRSTTNAALTRQVLPQSGAFSKQRLDDGDWVPAKLSGPRPPTTTVSVPPDAYTDPATAPALTSSFGAQSLVASKVFTFPSGCSEAWMRVAATGNYTVSLDGRTIAIGNAGPNTSTVPLSVIDLCPVLSGGHHVLSVAVGASSQPAIYLDGMVRSGSHVATFATGPGWHPGSSGRSSPAQGSVGVMAAPEADLGVLFVRTSTPVIVPPGPLLAEHVWLTIVLLAFGLLAVVIALVGGTTLMAAVTALLCGLLPAVGVVLVLTEFRHLVRVRAPFPSTPGMLTLVLVVAAVGVTAAVLSAVSSRRRRTPDSGLEVTPTRRQGFLRRRWYEVSVAVFGVGWSLVQSYHITFNPLWQDELSSLAAAQGMRAHLLPEWPSGFLYWKSELYTALIAVVGGVSHDSVTALREVTVFWFGATVLLFGLGLIPLVLPGRRVYQLVTTVVFATAPFELGHALDVRMYQMVQFFVVLVAVLLYKAIREPTTRWVGWLMVSVVAMYLTHEESFGVLLIIPLALCCARGLRWARNWRWWVFGAGAVAIIAVQLALAQFTHPPTFGVDPSGGPLIEWSPQPFYYLANFFFTNPTVGASVTAVSTLAVVGVVVGLIRRDALRLYLAAFWIVPTIVVSLALLTKDTRYAFICLPFLFALAACGTTDILDAVQRLVLRGVPRARQRIRRVFVQVLAGLAVVAIMLSLIGGINDYGVFTGALFKANVSHRWLDYPTAVGYVKAHLQPGDAVIAATSPNLVGYSLGRAPTYWIPPHRTETLLYVFEKHDQAVDTQYGIPTILNAVELNDALNRYRRVWLVGADSAIRSLIPPMRNIVETRFIFQEDGEFVSVYLATSS